MNDDERGVGFTGLHSNPPLSEPGRVVAGRLIESVLPSAPNSPPQPRSAMCFGTTSDGMADVAVSWVIGMLSFVP